MKRLLISCLIICGCGNTANLPGASSHSTGDTNTSNSTVTDNSVDTVTNNGVDTCKNHCTPTLDPDTGIVTWEVTQDCVNSGRQGPEFFATQPNICIVPGSSSSSVPAV